MSLSPALRSASFGLIFSLGLTWHQARAQEAPSFDELKSEVANKLLPDDELPPDLVDCPPISTTPMLGLPRDAYDDHQFQTQWIFNGAYYWIPLRMREGTCVFLTGDQQRGLTRDESRALLSAARLNVPDIAHPDAQRATNCLARADGRFGGDFPAFESGVINGRRYRIFFAPMAQELKLLDEAQHRYAEEQKRALTRLPARNRRPALGSRFDVILSFRRTGRSIQLASLEGALSRSDESDSTVPIFENWLLDIPRSRLISFTDLFVDPRAAQAYVADKYRRDAAAYVWNEMRDFTFLGDDAEQQNRDYRAGMLAAVERFTSASPPHLLRIEINFDPTSIFEIPSFTGTFTTELLPNGSPVFWHASHQELKPFFKPDYASEISGPGCPPLPSR